MSTTTIVRNGLHGTSGGSPPNLTGNAGSLVSVLDACLVTAMGWTKVYSGTNKAVYRAPTGNRYYLRIDDTGSTSARVRVYETMSDVDTGTGPTPTDVTLSGGAYISKSATADSTARPWAFFCDGKLFHLFVQAASTTASLYHYTFGDFRSFKRGGADIYNTVLLAHQSANPTSTAILANYINTGGLPTTWAGQYIVRAFTQIGGHVNVARDTDLRYSSATTPGIGGQGVIYPAPIQGGLIATPIWLHESISGTGSGGDIRGVLPGEWAAQHATPFSDGTIVTGPSGTDLAGRTFECFTTGGGMKMIETSNTWDSAP